MATRNTDGGSLTRFLRGIATLFTSPGRQAPQRTPERPARAQTAQATASVRDIAPGSAGETATIEIDPPDRRGDFAALDALPPTTKVSGPFSGKDILQLLGQTS